MKSSDALLRCVFSSGGTVISDTICKQVRVGPELSSIQANRDQNYNMLSCGINC